MNSTFSRTSCSRLHSLQAAVPPLQPIAFSPSGGASAAADCILSKRRCLRCCRCCWHPRQPKKTGGRCYTDIRNRKSVDYRFKNHRKPEALWHFGWREVYHSGTSVTSLHVSHFELSRERVCVDVVIQLNTIFTFSLRVSHPCVDHSSGLGAIGVVRAKTCLYFSSAYRNSSEPPSAVAIRERV
jgi:hypothetical protein